MKPDFTCSALQHYSVSLGVKHRPTVVQKRKMLVGNRIRGKFFPKGTLMTIYNINIACITFRRTLYLDITYDIIFHDNISYVMFLPMYVINPETGARLELVLLLMRDFGRENPEQNGQHWVPHCGTCSLTMKPKHHSSSVLKADVYKQLRSPPFLLWCYQQPEWR